MEELRPALKAHGVNKQCKEYRLDPAVDIDAQLPDNNADQKRPSDASQDEFADLQFTN